MPTRGYGTLQPATDGDQHAGSEQRQHQGDRRLLAGWYGMKKGLRGRFGMYMPPLLEALGLAEVEHNAKNNRMRAI